MGMHTLAGVLAALGLWVGLAAAVGAGGGIGWEGDGGRDGRRARGEKGDRHEWHCRGSQQVVCS